MDGELSPLRVVIERFATSEASVDPSTGALRLSHRPKVGTEAYACVLYPGVSADVIEQYESVHRSRLADYLSIPPFYRRSLARMNGGFIFGTSLFGIPQSMAQNPPLLNRSVQQPLDVCTANEHWRVEYGASRSSFYIASGSYSSTENIGYFLTPDTQIEGYLKGGKKTGQWETFGRFLAAEIQRAESRFSEFEEMMASIRSSKPKRKR